MSRGKIAKLPLLCGGSAWLGSLAEIVALFRVGAGHVRMAMSRLTADAGSIASRSAASCSPPQALRWRAVRVPEAYPGALNDAGVRRFFPLQKKRTGTDAESGVAVRN